MLKKCAELYHHSPLNHQLLWSMKVPNKVYKKIHKQVIQTAVFSFLKNLKQKEDFVLYIGRPDCKDCQEFEPYLKKYLKIVVITMDLEKSKLN